MLKNLRWGQRTRNGWMDSAHQGEAISSHRQLPKHGLLERASICPPCNLSKMLRFWLKLASPSPIRLKVSCYIRKAVLHRSSPLTSGAKTVQQEFMPGHLKPTGKECSLERDDRTGRSQLKHYVAFLAAEVVMMTSTRGFVTCALVRQVNSDDPAP